MLRTKIIGGSRGMQRHFIPPQKNTGGFTINFGSAHSFKPTIVTPFGKSESAFDDICKNIYVCFQILLSL